jgi:hypothetical protein
MSLCVLQVMSDNPNICEDRILSEIGMLFVEGFETTGHTTSWTLFNIASVPGVQEKIAEELDSLGLLAKPGCPPPKELELDDLKRVPYLVAATKEAMRMLPVVSIMGRCVCSAWGWECAGLLTVMRLGRLHCCLSRRLVYVVATKADPANHAFVQHHTRQIPYYLFLLPLRFPTSTQHNAG